MSYPTVFIVGPTATGKSHLAQSLAKQIGGCIVNADSIQLYQGLTIGSAAPTELEKSEVDHFLFQVIPKGQTWTASEYQQRAWDVVERELQTRPVIIAGGSGFYFQALERGMGDSKSESDEVKSQLEKELHINGAEVLYKELESVDPIAAEKIHLNDHYRLLRSLGYYRTYKTRLSEDQALESIRNWPGDLVKVGLTGSQEELKPVILKRVQKMLELGFLDEVSLLLKEGLESWWPLQSVGYKEVTQYLKSGISKENLVSEITLKTLHLAKRQKTWFKRDSQVKWFHFQEKIQALTWILSELS